MKDIEKFEEAIRNEVKDLKGLPRITRNRCGMEGNRQRNNVIDRQ